MNINDVTYGVVYMIMYPFSRDPEVKSLDLFSSFEEALEKTEDKIEEFEEFFGLDDDALQQHATKKKPLAIMTNGEVVGYAAVIETP